MQILFYNTPFLLLYSIDILLVNKYTYAVIEFFWENSILSNTGMCFDFNLLFSITVVVGDPSYRDIFYVMMTVRFMSYSELGNT